MLLNWRLHENVVADSATPMLFDFSHVELTGAQFSTIAQGGFGDGALQIKNPSERLIQTAVDNWFAKHVVATDNSGRIAYEGYVAEVHATLGHHSFIRSIDQFANRTFCDYKYKGGTCPSGSECKGRVQINESDLGATTTQTQYGIKEQWIDLSGQGGITSAIATAAATNILKTALHSRAFSFDLGYGAVPSPNSLTLVLWGYYTTLQWRKHSLAVRTSTDISNIVKSSLTTNSKAPLISTDQSQIASTGRSLTYNKDNKVIWLQDYIQGVIIEGDSNAKELFFQIWEGRMPYLTARPSAPRYFTRYDDNRIWDGDRNLIPPYMMRAPGFTVSENLNEALDPLTDIYQRERTSFVDRTIYDDVAEKLSLPTPGVLTSVDRILARSRRLASRYIV